MKYIIYWHEADFVADEEMTVKASFDGSCVSVEILYDHEPAFVFSGERDEVLKLSRLGLERLSAFYGLNGKENEECMSFMQSIEGAVDFCLAEAAVMGLA